MLLFVKENSAKCDMCDDYGTISVRISRFSGVALIVNKMYGRMDE